MTMDNRYDVIIIGTGAGGGTLAYHLAPSGKRILLLERGGYLPREKDNWESRAVFVESKYRAKETWYDKDGKPFSPGIQYYVGGNTKVYGAALLRFRERDFGEVRHHGGISLDEAEGKALPGSACVRCAAFDGFPCLVNGKADAQVICVNPALEHSNVELLTGACVERLETDASGRAVTNVVVTRKGSVEEYSADKIG